MDAYERIRTVGRGAYGVVILCQRRSDGALVIIKEIPVEEMTIEERQSALNEVKVLDMLDHPNIVAYFDSFVEDKALMIVMEYAEGGTIFEFLQNRQGELLPEKEIVHYFVQMVISIQAIHSHNILHRDLKTQNIMLDRDQKIVKIGDFGISKVLSSKSKANTVVGTPCYISPELCEGKPYNQKSDIWAVGCVLYEMVTLRRAFDAPNLPALVLKIMRATFAPIPETYSEALRKLILSTLHLDPNQRPGPSEILAQPICQNALLDLFTDIGRSPCLKFENMGDSRSGSVSSASRSGSAMRRTHGVPRHNSVDTLTSASGSSVFMWGNGTNMPRPMEQLADMEIAAVALTRTQLMAAASDGRVVTLKLTKARSSSASIQSTSNPSPLLHTGLQSVVVKQIACGMSFTSCLTDRDIVLTFGNGAQGCLGHGEFEDVDQPRIVEALLGVEVEQISAGSAHMMVTTKKNDVFAWGCGDNGRLGLGDDYDAQCLPQRVEYDRSSAQVASAHCGDDCTVFITTKGGYMGCGSNRHNKLGVAPIRWHGSEPDGNARGDAGFTQTGELSTPTPPAATDIAGPVVSVAIGSAHMVMLSAAGRVHTFGSNTYGQLGRPDDSKSPSSMVQALEDETVVVLAAGDAFSAVATIDSKVFGWGKEADGRLGSTGNDNVLVPREIKIPGRHTKDGRSKSSKKLRLEIESISCRFTMTVVTGTYTQQGEGGEAKVPGGSKAPRTPARSVRTRT